MEKACISVVPVHGDGLMVCAGERAKGAMVGLGLDELRPSTLLLPIADDNNRGSNS